MALESGMAMSFAAQAYRATKTAAKASFVAGVTAAVGVAVFAIGACLLALASGDSVRSNLSLVAFFLPLLFLLPFVIVLASLIIFAVPTMLLLRRSDAENGASYRIAGAAVGALLGLALGWGEASVPGLIVFVSCIYGTVAADLFFRVFRAKSVASG